MLNRLDSGTPILSRGIIVANKDPEKLGRVQVSYPWAGESSKNMPSEWAFVSMPFASKSGGFQFIPEKGDEVLVYFENGQMDHPIIIGSLYSQKSKPPLSGKKDDGNESGENTLRYIKTRSGHLLCFDDSSEDGGITLKDQDNRKFEIQTKKKQVLISDEKQNQISFKDGKISIEINEGPQISMEKEKVSIQAGGSSLLIDKDGAVTLNAKEVNLGSSAAEALLKGDTFVQLFNQHVHSTAMGPSGPPMVPVIAKSVLSMKVKTE